MKIPLCTLAGLLLVGVAGAQTQKGNGLISGGFSVNYNKAAYQQSISRLDYWQPSIDLTAGRFVADNWLVGASVSGTATSQKIQNGLYNGQPVRTTSINQVAVEFVPFVRRYWQFAPVQVFAGVGLSAQVNSERLNNGEPISTNPQDVPTNQWVNGVTIGPYLEAGVNYFVTKRLALQLSAATRSLPFSVASVNTGLVYWTGSDRKSDAEQPRDNEQTNRGNWVIEGGFSVERSSSEYESNTQRNQTTSSYTLSPSVGYFIGKNNLLGVSVPLFFGSGESFNQNLPTYTSNYWSVGIAPYFQHYWTSTRLTPYTRVGASYTLLKSGVNTNTTYTASATFGMGLAYMAGKRFLIETSLGSASVAYTPFNEADTNAQSWNVNLLAGLRGNFTVRYVLTRPD
ncbi:hypothetical protein [Spirosoma utsteinense]|uniref:Outer membrane protein beta-barrel domain-containing protein n=1 Tax=Spirosoma utsteinense TaxID=2585773 RepID=A0ABR6VZV3_9BACT|nr:hypothetical protein [Spirosoma utsteinense]MBC3784571.1 hypothetical protein [Spirosoma utsteinense]MBC3789677.1 hypothetical protein [Spirosoma utsteinense]